MIDEITADESTLLHYGRHKDVPYGKVPARWLMWAYTDHLEEMTPPDQDDPDFMKMKWALKGYIEDNMTLLEQEALTKGR